MKKVSLAALFTLGSVGIALGVSEEEQKYRDIVEICVTANCPKDPDSCRTKCSDKVMGSRKHAEKIGSSFLDIMEDCQQFTCGESDAKCLDRKISEIGRMKAGDVAPCYGGG